MGRSGARRDRFPYVVLLKGVTRCTRFSFQDCTLSWERCGQPVLVLLVIGLSFAATRAVMRQLPRWRLCVVVVCCASARQSWYTATSRKGGAVAAGVQAG